MWPTGNNLLEYAWGQTNFFNINIGFLFFNSLEGLKDQVIFICGGLETSLFPVHLLATCTSLSGLRRSLNGPASKVTQTAGQVLKNSRSKVGFHGAWEPQIMPRCSMIRESNSSEFGQKYSNSGTCNLFSYFTESLLWPQQIPGTEDSAVMKTPSLLPWSLRSGAGETHKTNRWTSAQIG